MIKEYKPLHKKSNDLALLEILTVYLEKLEGLKTHKLLENTKLIPSVENSIERYIKHLKDMIGYCNADNSHEISNRKDILYPYVCHAVRFYQHELDKNKSILKEILGDSPLNLDITKDLEHLDKLSKIYCKTDKLI